MQAEQTVAPAREDFDFGFALALLKAGKRVARRGWNGKGMYLFLVRPIAYAPAGDHRLDSLESTCEPSVAMKTAPGPIVVGWLASQTDMLAEDWQEVP